MCRSGTGTCTQLLKKCRCFWSCTRLPGLHAIKATAVPSVLQFQLHFLASSASREPVRAVFAMAGSMMASGRSPPLFARSAVYPQHFADQRVAPIVPMRAPKPMAPGVDRMLECAEERVVALRRAQQVRPEQQDLGETSRVTWRPPPTRDTRSHVLTPKPTPSTPTCKPPPHVTPKLMGSQSAQELLDLSFRKTPKLSRPWSAGDAPPYAPQRQSATSTFDSAIEIYSAKTKPSSGFDAQLRSRVAWYLLQSTAAALQAQVDEAARVRAQLEAELVERTASASQLEQECARLTAERLEERVAHEADKGALEAALERHRSRLRAALKASVALGLVASHEHRDGRMSRTSGADTAAFEAAASKQDELRRARQEFASEVTKLRVEVMKLRVEVMKLRVGLKLVLTLGLSIKEESDQVRFFADKQPAAKPTNVRLVEVTKTANSRVGVSLVMHGRAISVLQVASTSPFEGKVFPGDVISLASDGITSPKALDANGLSQYIFAASSLSLRVETPVVLASARSPSISLDLLSSARSPSTQQIARGQQHIEPTGGLADDPRLLPPRALRAGAPRPVENMVQLLQDAAARAESEVRAKHAELVADYRARTRTAEPLQRAASASSTTGFSSSSLYRISRG